MFAAVGKHVLTPLKEGLFLHCQDRPPITLADGHHSTDYQVWRVSFGEKEPGHAARYVVTTRPLMMQELQADRFGTVVHKKLQEVSPARLFLPNYYLLEYHLPGAPFAVQALLDDVEHMKRCYAALGRLSHGKRLRLANEADDRFKLLPRQTGAPVFDFEPEPLVKVAGGELKTVPALTAFLADLYMAGRISAEDLDKVMHEPTLNMRLATFELIPAREQPFHEYLKASNHQKPLPPLADRYHMGQITLQEFANLKRPDLSEIEQRKSVPWPTPERTYLCIICGEDRATIQCMECANRACSQCIRHEFTAHPNPEAGPHHDSHHHHHHHHHHHQKPKYEPETFLLLHHIYCLKNGRPSRAFLHGLRKKKTNRKLKPIAGKGK